MRTSKTVDGVKYDYYYAGDQLVRMTYGNNILDFYYNAHGTPILLNCNGNLFYYITNLQGDVIRLVDIYGQIAAMYQYDPYGNAVYALGSHATINPLRYRGYYYDTDTGLYYLQSRYYDPNIGRFINADAFVSTGQGPLGYNMFAYCRNNPVCRVDISGMEDAISYNDGELMSDDDLNQLATSGGGGNPGAWSIFMQSLQDAANGLNMAMGKRSYPSSERHHIVSNKSSVYTPQYKEITDRYNFSLDSGNNIIELENHRGRHTNAYHGFVLTCLNALDTYANGNIDDFNMGFMAIVNYIKDNPWLPYAHK